MGNRRDVTKDQVRRGIEKVALELFGLKGYRAATMREIARRSDMTIGNLYAYYRNKEQLFDCIVLPAYQEIERLIDSGQELLLSGRRLDAGLLAENFEEAASLFGRYHKQLRLLFRTNLGTKYERVREDLIRSMAEHIRAVAEAASADGAPRSPVDPFLYHLLGNFWVESFLEIVEHFRSQRWAERQLRAAIEVIFAALSYVLDRHRPAEEDRDVR
jgi:AcrR family transcriptional regulator